MRPDSNASAASPHIFGTSIGVRSASSCRNGGESKTHLGCHLSWSSWKTVVVTAKLPGHLQKQGTDISATGTLLHICRGSWAVRGAQTCEGKFTGVTRDGIFSSSNLRRKKRRGRDKD